MGMGDRLGGAAAREPTSDRLGPARTAGAMCLTVVLSCVIAVAPAWVVLPFGIPPTFDRACLFSYDPMSGGDTVGIETVHWSVTPYRRCTPVGPLEIGTSGPAFDAAVERLAVHGPYEGSTELTAYIVDANTTRADSSYPVVAAVLIAVWLLPPGIALLAGADGSRTRYWYRAGGIAATALGALYLAAALALRALVSLLL